jgi:hypothetical protein
MVPVLVNGGLDFVQNLFGSVLFWLLASNEVFNGGFQGLSYSVCFIPSRKSFSGNPAAEGLVADVTFRRYGFLFCVLCFY